MPKPNVVKRNRVCNPMQEKFAIAYASPTSETKGNALRSALAAGYSKSTANMLGSQMLRKAHIVILMDSIREQSIRDYAKNSAVDAKYIETKLLAIAEKAESEKKYADANRAWELVGRLRGLFRDTLDVDVSTSAEVDSARQAECRRIAAAMLSVQGAPALPSSGPVIDVQAEPMPAGCLASLPCVTSNLSSSGDGGQAQENGQAHPPYPPCTPGDDIK